MKKLISRLEKRRNTSSTSKACYERLENRQMLAGDSFWVYYGEGNKLFRSLSDGTQKQELMALTIQPGAVNADGIMVDLDRVNNKVYAIANQGHNPIHLYRSNLDGSNLELLNNSDSMGTIPQGIAVNEQTGAVYVSPHHLQVRAPGFSPGGMLRITNNGQTVTQFSQTPWYVTDMEVDAANGHVYYAVWPSWGGNQTHGWAGIRRMNLDGSNDIGIFQTGGNGSFALDTANNRIWFASTYSSSLQNDRIYTINLSGGNFQEKATLAGYTFGDIDLSESKDGIVFLSFPKTGNPNPNARIQQLAFTSTTAVPLFDTPNISAGIELLAYNRSPTLDAISDITIPKDSAAQVVNLTGITAGGSEAQPVRVTATSSNPGLIPNPVVDYNDFRFQAGADYAAGDTAHGTESGDFNGDSILDVAVVHRSGGNVSVYYGTGNGTFQDPVFWPMNSDTYSMAIADFNGDGLDDIAVTNFESNLVSVRTSTGNGFSLLQAFSTGNGSTWPEWTGADPIQAGDFNNDGKIDLVVGNTRHHFLSVLLGDGLGRFLAPIKSDVDPSGQLPRPHQIGPISLTVADFNRDGKLDVAVGLLGKWEAGADIPGDLRIMLGDGNGNFSLHRQYESGQYISSVLSHDFNGDTYADIVISSAVENGVVAEKSLVYLGDGNGNFSVAQALPTGAAGFRTADINKDGNVDILAFASSSSFFLYHGNGAGSFSGPLSINNPRGANRGGVVGDFDGNGWIDVAWGVGGGYVTGTLSTWLGRDNSMGTLTLSPTANQVGFTTITVSIEDGGPDGDLNTTSDNATFSRTFQVTVNPVNDAPTAITPASFTLDERTNTAGGYLLGTLNAADVDIGDVHTFTIVGGPDEALFSVAGTRGEQLRLTDGVLRLSKPLYQVLVRVTDSAGATYDQLLTVNVRDLLDVSQTVINAGAAQRSSVHQLLVRFDGLVEHNNAAFQVNRLASNGVSVGLAITWTDQATHTEALIRFTSSTRTQVASPVQPKSLVDGEYELLISRTAITRKVTGELLSADYRFGGDTRALDNFYALYGDATGTGVNGQVNNSDYILFRQAFGTNSLTFDFDGNGTVNNTDFIRFRQNFGRRRF